MGKCVSCELSVSSIRGVRGLRFSYRCVVLIFNTRGCTSLWVDRNAKAKLREKLIFCFHLCMEHYQENMRKVFKF